MLRVEALRMALTYVMNTYNTSLYQQIHRKLQEAVTSSVANHVFFFFFPSCFCELFAYLLDIVLSFLDFPFPDNLLFFL